MTIPFHVSATKNVTDKEAKLLLQKSRALYGNEMNLVSLSFFNYNGSSGYDQFDGNIEVNAATEIINAIGYDVQNIDCKQEKKPNKQIESIINKITLSKVNLSKNTTVNVNILHGYDNEAYLEEMQQIKYNTDNIQFMINTNKTKMFGLSFEEVGMLLAEMVKKLSHYANHAGQKLDKINFIFPSCGVDNAETNYQNTKIVKNIIYPIATNTTSAMIIKKSLQFNLKDYKLGATISLYFCKDPTCFNRDPIDIIEDNNIPNLYRFFYGGIENFLSVDSEYDGEICIPKFGNREGFVSEKSIVNLVKNANQFNLKTRHIGSIRSSNIPYTEYFLTELKQTPPYK